MMRTAVHAQSLFSLTIYQFQTYLLLMHVCSFIFYDCEMELAAGHDETPAQAPRHASTGASLYELAQRDGWLAAMAHCSVGGLILSWKK
jgi:hypothetical protein